MIADRKVFRITLLKPYFQIVLLPPVYGLAALELKILAYITAVWIGFSVGVN